METVQAPNPFEKGNNFTIFLAGSIEMGVAEEWQKVVIERLSQQEYAENLLVLNPRRDDWDSSWVQDITNDQFRSQVQWELDSIEKSDLTLVYFDPETQSPITLMELGLLAKLHNDVIVCCPDGFWRKGNVQVLCDKYNMKLTNTKDEFFSTVEEFLNYEFVGHTE